MTEYTDKYFSTVQVGRELIMDLSLLKKISSSIEKTLGNKGYYHRNNKSQRMYNTEQIDEIEKIMGLKKKEKVTYSIAIKMFFSNQSVTIKNNKKKDETIYQWFETMEIFMSMQEERIEMLTINLESLVNLEKNNFKTMQQMNGKIDEVLNYVRIYRNKKQRSTPKKQKTALGNTLSLNKSWISKKELSELKTKILFLPGIWKERKKKLEMNGKDKEYYTDCVENAKNIYVQALKEGRRVGKYYLISTELKETLVWYGKFYDYIN